MLGNYSHGYIATITLPDGRGGALLDLRCASAEIAISSAFRDLALRVCRVVAQHSPRFLDHHEIPLQEAEALVQEYRVEALRRGIPDEDLELYARRSAEHRMRQICLLDLPLGSGTVNSALEDFGHPVEVRRFYRASLDD